MCKTVMQDDIGLARSTENTGSAQSAPCCLQFALQAANADVRVWRPEDGSSSCSDEKKAD